jgi:glycosyl transferase, family 25
MEIMVVGPLFAYFDRIAIINLPERNDRLNSLALELAGVGLDIRDPKVSIPEAPKPLDANGFRSRGVYGNLLSHLSILEGALADNLESVLILEDDAIFSHAFNKRQFDIAQNLKSYRWDQLFIGHSIWSGLPNPKSGIVRYGGEFFWAHCYAVHRRVLVSLVDYIHATIERPAGHSEGAKMYIDAVLNEFRRRTPDLVCLVTSPCLSVQRGSPSSLNSSHWYDRNKLIRPVSTFARTVRDECWRYGLITIKPKKIGRATPMRSAQVWPTAGAAD